MNRSTGAALATAAVGGGDQLTYDPTSNRYYVTASNWNPTGIKAATSVFVTPVLGIVAATTGAVVARLPAGQGSHGVTVDPNSGLAFMPHTASTAAVCPDCKYTTSGVSIYVIR